MNNPFNPSFGKVPPVFIGREEIVQTLVEGLADFNSPYQTTMISGIRGVGKTALLTDVCRNIAKNSSWIIADIPPNSDILENLIQTIQTQADSTLRKALGAMDGISVSALGVGVGLSAGRSDRNPQLILEQMLQKMQKQGRRLLVAIDEVTASEPIRLFASVYQILIRKDYPISLLMTGLPRNISELQNDKVLTFLLRSARVNLPMLNHVNIQYSYKNTFAQARKEIQPDALKIMTSLTNGYSYAFQLLGYLVWKTEENSITAALINSVMDSYKEKLFRNAYTKIYEELSGVDRGFLKAMAISGEDSVPMKEISRRMGKNPGYISTYKRRLLDSGVIETAAYGYVRFSLPLFRDYLLEFQI